MRAFGNNSLRVRAVGSNSVSQSDLWQHLSDLFRSGRLREMNDVFTQSAPHEAGKGVYKLMLQKAKQEGDADWAISLFEQLISRNEAPDEAMFHFVIETLLDKGRVAEAMAYLGLETSVSERQLEEKARSPTSLLAALPKSSVISPLLARIMSERASGELPDAHLLRMERILEEAKQRRIPVSGAMMAAALRVRVKCDEGTPALVAVKKALSLRSSVDPALLEAGMSCLVESGSREQAWWLYEQHGADTLATGDLSRRPAHRLLVVVLKCAPSYVAARTALENFVMHGFRPDAFSYHCLLLSLCRDPHEAERVRVAETDVLASLQQRELLPFAHTPTVMAALRMAEQQLPWRDALQEAKTTSENDAATIGALMEQLGQLGRGDLVLQIWEEAFCGPTPDIQEPPGEKVFLAALRACVVRVPPRGTLALDPRYESVLAGLAAAAFQQPSNELLVAALRAEGLAGQPERAVATFQWMLSERQEGEDPQALRGVVVGMVKVQKGERGKKKE